MADEVSIEEWEDVPCPACGAKDQLKCGEVYSEGGRAVCDNTKK